MRSDRCGAFVVNVAFVGSFLCFDIEIPDEAAEGITTVGDAVKYIEDKQA